MRAFLSAILLLPLTSAVHLGDSSADVHALMENEKAKPMASREEKEKAKPTVSKDATHKAQPTAGKENKHKVISNTEDLRQAGVTAKQFSKAETQVKVEHRDSSVQARQDVQRKAESTAAKKRREEEEDESDAEMWPFDSGKAAKAVKAVKSMFSKSSSPPPPPPPPTQAPTDIFTDRASVDDSRCKVFPWNIKCENEDVRKGWVNMGSLPDSHKSAKKCGASKNEQCAWCCPPVNEPSGISPEDSTPDPGTTIRPTDTEGWSLPALTNPFAGGGMPDFKFPGLPAGAKINDPSFPGFDVNLPEIKVPNLPNFPNYNPSLPSFAGGLELPSLPGIPGSGGGGSTAEERAKTEQQEKTTAEALAQSKLAQNEYEQCWRSNGHANCRTQKDAADSAKDKYELEQKNLDRQRQHLDDATQLEKKAGEFVGDGHTPSQEMQDLIKEASTKLAEDSTCDNAVPKSRSTRPSGCNRCVSAKKSDYPKCDYSRWQCSGDQCAVCDEGKHSDVDNGFEMHSICGKVGATNSAPNHATGRCSIPSDAPKEVADEADKIYDDAIKRGMDAKEAEPLRQNILDQTGKGCSPAASGCGGRAKLCRTELVSDATQGARILVVKDVDCLKRVTAVQVGDEKEHNIASLERDTGAVALLQEQGNVIKSNMNLKEGLGKPMPAGTPVVEDYVEALKNAGGDPNKIGMTPAEKDIYDKAVEDCKKKGVDEKTCKDLAINAADAYKTTPCNSHPGASSSASKSALLDSGVTHTDAWTVSS